MYTRILDFLLPINVDSYFLQLIRYLKVGGIDWKHHKEIHIWSSHKKWELHCWKNLKK
jgi:hypothetical protein